MEYTNQPRHELVYAEAAVYEVGFGGVDLQEQCGFLDYLSRNIGRKRLDSYLEICCGPGYHMQFMADRGIRSYGIDFSAEMVALVAERAAERRMPDGGGLMTIGATGEMESEPSPPPPFRLEVKNSDMTRFSLPEAVDLAFCPRSGFRYLLKQEDIISHFVTVSKNLGRGGLYVLELDHPSIIFCEPERRRREWSRKQGEMSVNVKIEEGLDPFDPIDQMIDQKITMEITEGDAMRQVTDRAPVRMTTYQELRALVQLSGVFEWVATFGDIRITQAFDNSHGARRMIPILRCSV